jgi:PmbA protein
MKEKYIGKDCSSKVKIEETKIVSFEKIEKDFTSFRIHKDGIVGVHYQEGIMSDEEGFSRAEKNLALKRPYPFELEEGVRHRDKTEVVISDKELMDIAKKCVSYLKKNYPQFNFFGTAGQYQYFEAMTNEKGLDYSSKDAHVNVNVEFKHVDSKDIINGGFNLSLRKFNMKKFKDMADSYLQNYEKMVELPEEIILMDRYYNYTGKLRSCLNAEDLKKGTSLLSGKLGQQLFSENFTVYHDTSDKNAWMGRFWDGDGVVNKGDKVTFIKNGKLIRGYADKKIAKKYRVKNTAGASEDYADIPKNGCCSMTIKPTKKSAKELLNGRLAVIPIIADGGGFKEKGEYTMPIQVSYLTDGEKILGRLPEFTIKSNMFDMFGKDFIGVTKPEKLFNDKTILLKMEKGEV